LRLIIALAGIVAGLVGLTLDWVSIIPATMVVSESNPVARSFAGAFVYYWTYFTHLTNLWLLLTYVALLTGWRWLSLLARPVVAGSAAAFILLVMIYYHVMLAPFFQLEGAVQIASYLLHYVTPIIFLVWWTLFAPHGTLRLASLPAMIVPGVIYIAWVLARGAVVNEYPYDILDAGKNGYGGVAIGVLVLLVAVSVFGLIVIGTDRWMARRSASA